MAFKDCIDAIKKASGRDITDDEADAIYTAVQDRIKRELRAGMDYGDAARKAGKDLSEEMRLAIAIEKRSATINALKWAELNGRKVEGREADAIAALVTGFQGRRGRPGNFSNAALSVDAMGVAAVSRATGALAADLERAGLAGAAKQRNAVFEADVIREMWRLDDPNAAPPTGNKPAEQVAEIFAKHLEIARLEQNKAGAWIGKLDHYVGRQSHDRYKIRGTGNPEQAFQAWREVIEPRLDARTFDGLETAAERTSWLRETWKALASGIHESPGEEWLQGFKGFANLAKKVSQSRKLHFASPDAWLEYNAQFGQGNVWDAVLHGIETGQRNAAAMRVMGTNPQSMLDRLVRNWADDAKERGDVVQSDRILSEFGKNSRILDRAMQKTIAPQSQTAANVGALVRNIQMFKLGSSLFSSFTDLSSVAATARHNGIGVMESMADSVSGLLPTDTAARREAAYQLGVGLDSFRNSIVNRFMSQDAPVGQMAGAVKVFMKVNGQNWWTTNMKESFGMSLGHNLARQAGKDFGALPPLLQTTLRRYGIEAPEWQAIRQGVSQKIDGIDYIFPASALDLPDSVVSHLGTKGPDAAREELHDKLSTYVVDQVNEGMSEQTAGVRDLMTGGSLAPGSFWGEATRTVMQFKSFTTSFMMRSIARELFRDGVNGGGIATIIAGSTALGYLAMTMKELARGREPRKPETFDDYRKLVMASMAQGGGFGLYGDFLFGEQNRFGGGALASALGPTAGMAEDFVKVYQALVAGDTKQAQNEGLQVARQLPPLSATNLWFTRAAMDYLVFWRLQETINPGWARRYEQNVRKNNDQSFWLSPSEAVR